MKKFALVLGGGAAKGYAHIGILKLLERHGLKPDLIVGTSMGSLVGGLYASGIPVDELQQEAYKFNGLGNFSLISTLFKGNMLNVDKVNKFLNNALQDKTHADCITDFRCVATELNTGKEKVFDSGLLRESILASISIPGVFPSVELDGNTYCDGGVVNNLPEDVARRILPDAVILSVDVIGPYAKQVENNKMKVIANVLNSTTLLTTGIVSLKPQLADIRITMSMPEIGQMAFNKTSVDKAIRKGVNALKNQIKHIKELLES